MRFPTRSIVATCPVLIIFTVAATSPTAAVAQTTNGQGAPGCLPAVEPALTRVAEELSPQPAPLDDTEIEETFRYPAFRISVSDRHPGRATVEIGAVSYRGPAGLYGSPIVPQARFARMGMAADCPAYLNVQPVVHKDACWLTSEGNKCQVKWWPASGPNCLPESEGGTCTPIVRRVSLGRPIKVSAPRAQNRGVFLQLEIPSYLVPGKCVCVTNNLEQQDGGFSNVILLR